MLLSRKFCRLSINFLSGLQSRSTINEINYLEILNFQMELHIISVATIKAKKFSIDFSYRLKTKDLSTRFSGRSMEFRFITSRASRLKNKNFSFLQIGACCSFFEFPVINFLDCLIFKEQRSYLIIVDFYGFTPPPPPPQSV